MTEPNKKFDVPLAYYYQKIDVETRKTLYKTIVEGFTKEFNSLKLMGAYLNWDMEEKYDFIAIFETTNTRGIPFVLYSLNVFGDRHSIQGFHYCVLHDKIKEYFEDSFMAMVPIEKDAFNSMISKLGFTFNKGDATFWKKPENMKQVASHLKNVAIFYKPQIKV